jgi:hypothetical protein
MEIPKVNLPRRGKENMNWLMIIGILFVGRGEFKE